MDELADLDLQLLLVLEALYRERSVTLAGQRLGRSQPAVSNALARLRALLDDELFVRIGNQMQPTPRVQRLMPGVLDGLARLRRTLRDAASFDPATVDDEVRIGMTDYGSALILPPLLARLAREAPGLRVRVSQTTKAQEVARLDAGEVDLLVAVADARPGIRRAALLEESFLVLGADLGAQLDLETFVRRPHLLVTLADDAVGVIDEHLAALGHRRAIIATVPHFLAAAWVATHVDVLVMMPARLAVELAVCHGLQSPPPPMGGT